MSLSRISFRDFLLNENKHYLGQRIGDVLTALQDLQQNSEGMGRRQVTANAQRVVDQIRSILHSNWSKKEEKYLKAIQRAGVAIARAIEEKDNLEEILPSAAQELEQVVSRMGVPVNSLATPPDDAESDGNDEQLAGTQGKEKEPQPQAQQAEQPPQQPPQGQQPPPDMMQQQPPQQPGMQMPEPQMQPQM